MEHVEHKDVVLGLLGAASAMAALVLVFLGFIVGALQPFDALTSKTVLRPYQVVASGLVGAFLLGIASVTMEVWWLANSQSTIAYRGSVLTFVFQLVLLVAVAVWTLWKLVFRK